MYGLALGGGGSRGSYEIGVLRALEEMEIPIGAVTGTSIGAINAAGYLMGDLDHIERIWRSLTPSSLINLKELNFSEVLRNKGFDNEPLLRVLRDILDEDIIRENPMDLGIVTVNVTTLKPVVLFKEEIPKGQLIDYIAASASHPTLRRHVIDGEEYIDGAFYDNIPVKPLAQRGYQEIIAVNLKAYNPKRHLEGPYRLTKIEPGIHLGSILFPDPDTIDRNITFGYMDTLKAFQRLYGHQYYFRSLTDSPLLTGLSAQEIRELEDSLYLPLLRRTLEEHAAQLGSHGSLPLTALEITAETLCIDNSRIFEEPIELLYEVLTRTRDILTGIAPTKRSEVLLLKELSHGALSTLSVTHPKAAIGNLFLKMVQKRMLEGAL